MGLKSEIKNREGRNSRTKIGAILIGGGAAIATIGRFIQGDVQALQMIIELSTEVGMVLAAFGIRDLPILNQLQKLDNRKKKR